MQIDEKIEYDIKPQVHQKITELRNRCFPKNSKDRSYFKQLPHFRYLAYEDGILVGQMGVDHRVISVSEQVFIIFGVIDLCVSSDYQDRGIASTLLKRLSALAEDKQIGEKVWPDGPVDLLGYLF